MKLLNTFCCGCRLQTGTIIIGVIELILLLFLFGCAIGDIATPKDDIRIPELWACFYSIILITLIFLLAGALQGIMWFIIPWLGTHMAGIISLPIYLLYCLIELPKSFSPNGCAFPEKWALVIAEKFAAITLYLYFVMVVLSYYDELRRDKAQAEMEEHTLFPISVNKC